MSKVARIKFLIISIIGILASIFILNLKTTYNQGINYEYKFVKIPLCLKIIDFFSRHYHYKDTVEEITKGVSSDEEKILRLFKWTHKNIKPTPQELPVVDDHVWSIIVRGYGEDDQFNDVFTTLCNYAGMDAFFTWIKSPDQKRKVPFSFVKMKEKWFVFDPYYGIYFNDAKGNLADIETIKAGNYSLCQESKTDEIDYSGYIADFPLLKDIGLTRANTQSPLNRFLLEIKKINDKLSKKRSKNGNKTGN